MTSERVQAGSPTLSEEAQRLSEFEYHLAMVMFGFSRWIETCMNAADVVGLNALDILVLHALNRRPKGQRLSEIGLVMNIDDTHLVAYSLKKLMNAKLVEAKRIGRERIFVTTVAGDATCMSYHKVREKFLVGEVVKRPAGLAEIERVSQTLADLVSAYDRAGRTALLATATWPKAPPLRTKR